MEALVFFDYLNVADALNAVDYGSVAPASSDDTMLHIYNSSDLYQAEDVSVSVSGDDAIQLWLSADGDTFTTVLQLGDIPPGAMSPTFWLRRVTPSTQSAGRCTASLNATPAGWTHPVDTSTTVNVPLETEGS